jgi:hypothetical protein
LVVPVAAGIGVGIASGLLPGGHDAAAYFRADPLDPYERWAADAVISEYKYSPAFAQMLLPLRFLPWPAFVVVWTTLLGLALGWLYGRLALAALLLPPITVEILLGNVHLLLGVAIVLGTTRWPEAWGLVALTKVTPAVGLLWFVIRREWVALARALAVVLLITAASFAVAPGAWHQWLQLLVEHGGDSSLGLLAVPLVPRLALAVGLVAFAARTDRSWLVPVAAFLSLPILHWTGLALLLAIPRLRAEDSGRRRA